jgi:riboflavin synthase
MFTGIIESVGIVRKIAYKGADAVLEIESGLNLDEVQIGDSIAVNGACLTVVTRMAGKFSADVSAETLSKTNLKILKPGDRVNLEKSLRLQSFLGGHLVLGHVDGIGKIVRKEVRSGSIVFGIETDKELKKYIVEKGSVAVDGVSLTVNSLEGNRFFVNIIPHTANATTLEARKLNDSVNIETDIIGKYVDSLLNGGRKLDKNFLAEHGFLTGQSE